jgi:hypothetical protein
MTTPQLPASTIEILPPPEKKAPYQLNLPGLKCLATDELDGMRIVHAVCDRLPVKCTSCGYPLLTLLKFGVRNLWDNPDGSTLTAIHLFVPKLRCLKCGTEIWCEVSCVYPGSRVTKRLVETILRILAEEPQSFAQISRRTGVNPARIQRILRDAHAELEATLDKQLGETTGIDDFFLHHRLVTTIGTTTRGGQLNGIIDAADAKAIRKELSQFANLKGVKNLTLDFSKTNAAAALKGDKDDPAPLKNARPAVNRFHFAKQIIKAFNNAQNKVFIQIRADLRRSDPVKRQQFLFAIKSAEQLKREADKRAEKSAKPVKSLFWNLRRLLTKRPENLKKEGAKETVRFVLEKYPLLREAYELKNFALDLRLAGKSTEQAMAEFEMFRLQLGKLSRKRGGKAIAKCFEPFVDLIEKWQEAAFPTIPGTNNNLERMHEELRSYIRIGRGYSIPGLVRRMQWRQAKKRTSRWPQELAGKRGMTLRKAVEILSQQQSH